MILGIAFNVVLGCPQLVLVGTRTTRHVNKGYLGMYAPDNTQGNQRIFHK